MNLNVAKKNDAKKREAQSRYSKAKKTARVWSAPPFQNVPPGASACLEPPAISAPCSENTYSPAMRVVRIFSMRFTLAARSPGSNTGGEQIRLAQAKAAARSISGY